MNVMARLLVPALAALSTTMVAAPAQQPPRRPRLAAEADTNDPASYFQYGLDRLARDRRGAAAAFYWAARLEPASPQAWYASHTVELMADRNRLGKWFLRDTRTIDAPEVAVIDSLRWRAEARDPFLHRGLDEQLVFAYARVAIQHEEWFLRSEDFTSAQARQVENYFEQTDPYVRGLMSYGRGDLRTAQQYWILALRNRPVDFVLAERGRAWMEARLPDSALVYYHQALDMRRRAIGTADRHVFESTAALYTAFGRVCEERRDPVGARAAYVSAVAENPDHWPARVRLAPLMARAGDTTLALAELFRAVTSPAADYFTLTSAATAIATLRPDSAVAWLRRATEREPWAAQGWLMLARQVERAGDTQGAITAYERFLALAPRTDASRLVAEGRLGQLRAPR